MYIVFIKGEPQVRIKTTKGNITASEELMNIIIDALKKAAEYEKEKGHLKDHDSFRLLADEVYNNAGN